MLFMKRGTLPALVAVACATVAPQTADASGFATARFGGEHGHPTTTNPTAIYYNPAAMTASDGVKLFIDGTLALRYASFDNPQAPSDSPEPADAKGANYGKGTLFNPLAAPMLGVTGKIGKLALGAGVFAPFGGSATFDENDQFKDNPTYPGAVDGPARWHHIDGASASIYISGGAAYEFDFGGPSLSIGATGSLVLNSLNTVRARNADAGNDVTIEGRSFADVSGVQGAVGVGLMAMVIEDELWIGASYQSSPGLGEMKMSGTLDNALNAPSARTEIDLYQHLPDIIRLGMRYRASDSLELRLWGDYTRWSLFENQCLQVQGKKCAFDADGRATEALQNFPRNWNDAFQVRVGASYFTQSNLEIFGGLGFDSNAVPDETLEPAYLDANDISAAAGVRIPLGEKIFLAGSYTHLYYLDRDTTGKSTAADPTLISASRTPDSGGKYVHQIGIINANLEVGF